jgi:hypothetical protein
MSRKNILITMPWSSPPPESSAPTCISPRNRGNWHHRSHQARDLVPPSGIGKIVAKRFVNITAETAGRVVNPLSTRATASTLSASSCRRSSQAAAVARRQ